MQQKLYCLMLRRSLARPERKFGGTQARPFHLGITNGGQGEDIGQMLGSQARIPAMGADAHQPDGLTGKDGQAQGSAQHLPPSLAVCAVDGQHSSTQGGISNQKCAAVLPVSFSRALIMTRLSRRESRCRLSR